LLATVIDCHSKAVIGWATGEKAIEMAAAGGLEQL
jgi:hypothetical protein